MVNKLAIGSGSPATNQWPPSRGPSGPPTTVPGCDAQVTNLNSSAKPDGKAARLRRAFLVILLTCPVHCKAPPNWAPASPLCHKPPPRLCADSSADKPDPGCTA